MSTKEGDSVIKEVVFGGRKSSILLEQRLLPNLIYI